MSLQKQSKQANEMYNSLFVWLLIALFILVAYSIASAETVKTNGESDYYTNSKRGYWWYEDPIKEEKKQEKKEEKVRVLPSMKDYSYEQLWNMHPDDFQALLMEFQKKAVQSPTEDNVVEYKTIQDIARRKALAYANVDAYVTQKYPEFNVGKDYPVAIPGRNALTMQMEKEKENKIMNEKNDFALLYFYSPSCPYCKEQDGILQYFVKKYGWQIKKINKDSNHSLALQFGIDTVPSLLLIYRNSQDYMPVSVGVASVADIEEKLFRGIRILKGEITPENWSIYDFQKGSSFDTKAHLRKR